MSNGTPPEIIVERELDRADGWVALLARVGGQAREMRRPLAPENDGQVEREVERLRPFVHPNLPRLVQTGTHEGRPFLMVEHAAGPTLQGYLDRQGPLPWRQVLDLARPLASALKFAHDRGLLLGEISTRKLAFLADPESGGALPAVRIASFPPPVRKPGDTSVGPRVEVHGLGRVLVTLLTGQDPDLRNPLAGMPPGVPGEVRVLLERMLDFDPANRPADGNTLCRQLDKVRSSLQEPPPSELETKEATAALVSQYVREELENQKRGGPVQRFFNQPWVIVLLFLLCVGTLVWTFWPSSAEGLFARGAALMKSDDPADWAKAFTEFFDPMEAKFPDHAHKADLQEFRQRLTQSDAETAAARRTRQAGPMTEAQWAYQEALRRRQIGDEEGARKMWQALIDAFGGVPSEGPWVRLAKQRLADPRPEEVVQARQALLQPVREARAQIQQLREKGKNEEAAVIERALKTLYPDDKFALPK
jgi:hypothetical protein